MPEHKKQTDWECKQHPTYLILAALLVSIVFSLSICAGEKTDMSCQQPNPSPSSSRSIKPSVSGTRVIPQAVTASKRSPGGEPESATDGDVNTIWLAEYFAPQWIQFDLGEPTAVSEILLNVEQTPEGPTLHKIYGGPAPDNLKLLGTLGGNTQSRQWLALKITATSVRYLKVVTTKSPSWVAWREIEVYK